MKLHKDGTVEGTPSEIAEYTKLQSKRDQFKVIQPSRVTYADTKTPALDLRAYVSPADYVRGVLNAIGKGYYH